MSTPASETPSASTILKTLKPGHPRLLADSARFEELRAFVATNALGRKALADIRREADKLLSAPLPTHDIPDGLRLLATSRRVTEHVYTLAMAYRLTGSTNYAARCWRELEAAAAFPDWNPRHFLDTAEMTHAFAIGYDWLYDCWTPAQCTALREAIVRHGLQPGLACYRGTERYGWWTTRHHNWNQVCNGGLGVGALAIADEEPALCGEILQQAVAGIPLAIRAYAPDGAWAEGPGYWEYATDFTALLIAALDSALGTDFGLSRIEGLSLAGSFPAQVTGSSRHTFNYADAHEGQVAANALLWLARRYRLPELMAFRLASSKRITPVELLWYDPTLQKLPAEPAPSAKYFRSAEVVCMRTGWDTNALFVACKAGDNQVNHSHLDIGTFVVDAFDRRFVSDLGSDDYNLPSYFGTNRWTYYRLRAEGHNTLVIDPGYAPDQRPEARASVSKFTATREGALAVMDLTPAYAQQSRRVHRGIRLTHPCARAPSGCVRVQDEVELKAPGEVWWFLHTPAAVELLADGKGVRLTLQGRSLEVRLVAPAGGKLVVMPAGPLPSSPHPQRQNANAGMQKLALHLENVAQAAICIDLVPVPEAGMPSGEPSAPEPLAGW